MTDPKTGARIVRRGLQARRRSTGGRSCRQRAELQVGLADGYRASWQTTPTPGLAPGIVYPNMKKWSGDHGSFDYKSTPGTLISSRPLAAASPRIIDIAPTVLKYFGVPIPSRYRWQAALLRRLRRSSGLAVIGRLRTVAAVASRPSASIRPRADRGARAARHRTAAGAAARSRSPGVGGAHAPRRPPQARGRAPDQGRGAEADRWPTPCR